MVNCFLLKALGIIVLGQPALDVNYRFEGEDLDMKIRIVCHSSLSNYPIVQNLTFAPEQRPGPVFMGYSSFGKSCLENNTLIIFRMSSQKPMGKLLENHQLMDEN